MLSIVGSTHAAQPRDRRGRFVKRSAIDTTWTLRGPGIAFRGDAAEVVQFLTSFVVANIKTHHGHGIDADNR